MGSTPTGLQLEAELVLERRLVYVRGPLGLVPSFEARGSRTKKLLVQTFKSEVDNSIAVIMGAILRSLR